MPFYEEDKDNPEEPRRRCRHIFTAGRRCGSPCLRSEQFCYHHHTTRRPVEDPRARRARTDLFTLPEPEDRESVRAAVAQVMHAVAQNAIDLKRAGMILYSLQIALCTFPPSPRPAPSKTADNSIPLRDIAEDVVVDETHGLIAPEDEYQPPEELKTRKSLARQLLDEVERYEARQAAEKAQEEAEAAAKAAPHAKYEASRQEALDFFEAEDTRLNQEAIDDARKYGLEPGPNGGMVPIRDSKTWVSPAPQAHRATTPEPAPHRPAAIDLRAAADTENSRQTARKSDRIFRKCHPERSLARLHAKRSRRICGSGTRHTRPQLPITENADSLRE